MNKANECTCPSGDGSLRWPYPAHPEQQVAVAAKLTFINGRPAMCGCQVEYSDGGGEYSDVIYVTLCAKHSGSAILDLVATNRIALTPEYEGQWHADLYLDREIPLAKVEGATPAEAVLALMSAERIDPEQESVEQASGDERAAFEAAASKLGIYTCNFQRYTEETAAHENRINARVEDPVRVGDYRSATLHDCWKIWQEARAALAQPSPVRSSLLINGYQLRAALDFIAPDGTAEQLESEACIEWRQQDADFLEAGLYAFCAEYPEEGGVLLDEEPTNSQPSPAQELAERGTQHRFSTTEQTCRHDFAGVWWNDNGETKTGKECRECGFFIADIAEAPELERPEVVGYLATAEHPKHGQPHKAFNYFKDQHDAQVAHWRERGCTVTEDRLMTVAQHERIVKAWIERWKAYIELSAKIAAQRDAAQARVEQQERTIAGMNEAHAKLAGLYEAAQAQHSVPELLEWAVDRWHAEVSLRPLINVHRRALDDTWRQVIRRLGGDTGLLCGPSHDELLAAAPGKEVGHE
ncbi:TPA: hypothetical protein SL599_003806 [Pseudomonas aeruginosa]|nr:hypothetical protein [Pseudomonas aeruginosa]HEJ2641451.1 hypothetical protein [Pseudomonas aeruginosa]HEJ4710990.1 hypothetical protein [Pseudomonas aeruginosa]